MVIFLQSISFVVRNTSPIGWVVILLLKAFEIGQKKHLIDGLGVIYTYAVGFLLVFLPVVGLSVLADSKFYGELSVVAWNFVKVNVLEGHSQSFGADPWHRYLSLELPVRFNIFFVPLVLGFGAHWHSERSKGRIPYLIIFSLSYLCFLSSITHKEPKFLLPIFPPCFLMIGQFLSSACFKNRRNLLTVFVSFGVLLELAINCYFVHVHEIGAFNAMREAQALKYRSLIINNKFEGNYLSLNHRKDEDLPNLVFVTHDPPFVKNANPDIPLIMSIEHPLVELVEFMSLIENYSDLELKPANVKSSKFFESSSKLGLPEVKEVPEVAIVEPLNQKHVEQALFGGFMNRYYEEPDRFYYGIKDLKTQKFKYRALFKAKI